VGYFEEVAKVGDPKEAINWITHELLGQLAYRNEPFKTNPISVAAMQELLSRLKNGELTGTSAKTLIRHILDTKTTKPISSLVEELSLRASPSDSLAIQCQAAIDALPQESEAVRMGNQRVLMKLVGHVMKHSRGTANARDATEILRQVLTEK